MTKDKFKAVWVSHSSIGDFIKCPRLYFLNNVYKDPTTGHKIQIMSPPLALGQVVHSVIESLSVLPVDKRLEKSLIEKYKKTWKNVSGKKGGFTSEKQEEKYKERGAEMIQRVIDHPGPITNLAVKIKGDLPYYYISEEDEIILCGKIDWLEYLPYEKSVHIIDFKTGKRKESDDSLQLPIYYLLVKNTQSHNVAKASYWYLERNDEPVEVELPKEEEAKEKVLNMALKIKDARKNRVFACPNNGCRYCEPMEAIAKGKGKFVGVSDFNQDIYVLS